MAHFIDSFENGVVLDNAANGPSSYFFVFNVPHATAPAFARGWDGGSGILGNDAPAAGSVRVNDVSIIDMPLPAVSVRLGALPATIYEAGDDDGIRIYADITGFGEVLIGRFAPPASGNGLFLDTDNNGIGDGIRLTEDLEEFTFFLPTTGSDLDIRIEVTSTDNNETIAIDHLVVQSLGAPVLAETIALPPGETIEAEVSLYAAFGGGFGIMWSATRNGIPNFGIDSFHWNADYGATRLPDRSSGLPTMNLPVGAVTATGRFVQAYTNTYADELDIEVYEFPFGDAGTTDVGAELTTSANHSDPAIATFADGSYVVAYTGGSTEDLGDTDIFFRLVPGDGNLWGSRFEVEPHEGDAADNAQNANVAVLSNGNFVIVWDEEYNGSAGDLDVFYSIRSPLDPTVGIRTSYVPGALDGGTVETDADIAALAGGGFVVAWTDGSNVRASVVTNGGDAVNTGFAVPASDAGTQSESRVAALPDGGFIVTWFDAALGVLGQRFAPDGTKVGAQFTLSTALVADYDIVATSDGRLAFSQTGQGFAAKIFDPRGEVISGTVQDDVIVAREAGGTVKGFDGADILVAGSGTDRLMGQGDGDVLRIAAGHLGAGEIYDGGDGTDVLQLVGNGGTANFAFFPTTLTGLEFLALDPAGGNLNATFDAVQFAGFTTVNASAHAGRAIAITINAAGSLDLSGLNVGGFNQPNDRFILNVAADLVHFGTAVNDVITVIGGVFSSITDLIDGDGNDTVNGGVGVDYFYGSLGNDTYDGNGGTFDMADYSGTLTAVTVNLAAVSNHATGAGIGTDQLIDIEDVTGGSGHDTLTGNGQSNLLDGFAGDDTLAGGGGRDLLLGGTGRDSLNGGEGDDDLFTYSFYGGAGPLVVANETYAGGTGTDRLNAAGTGTAAVAVSDFRTSTLSGLEQLLVAGSTGAAFGGELRFTAAQFVFDRVSITFDHAASVAVVLKIYLASATPVLDLGDTEVTGFTGNDRFEIFAGSGVQTITGSSAADIITGGTGNDTINGGAGIDTAVFAGNRAQYSFVQNATTHVLTITGPDGTDTLTGINKLKFADVTIDVPGFTYAGGPGPDSFVGGDNADDFFGAGGDDIFSGGGGNDDGNAGPGNDVVTLGAGNDRMYGSNGNDTLRGETGLDVLVGDSGTDTLDGGADNDRLFGGSGNDVIRGGDGADFIDGAAGDDDITGGAGNDRLQGRGGADDFFFAAGSGADRIFGFEDNIDTLHIDGSDYGFANAAAVVAATSVAGGNLFINLGGGNSINLWLAAANGVTAAELGNDIVVF